MNNMLSALYITRKYPPSIGGMQEMNFQLVNELSRLWIMEVIAWGTTQILLPLFFLKVFAVSFFLLCVRRRKFDYCIFGDALLSPFAGLFRKFLSMHTVCIVHGLDITYPNRLYQHWVVFGLTRCDFLICVSRHTKEECVRRGISPDRITVIPNGARSAKPLGRVEAIRILQDCGLPLSLESKLIISVGRLVKRKGIAGFIKNVITSIKEREKHFTYAVIGDGQERNTLIRLIKEYGLEGRVAIMGKVSDECLRAAYSAAAVLVMPNIEIEGDTEGFGIVALEAASYGLPVIASDLEGLKDALMGNLGGFLIPHDRPDLFGEKLLLLLGNRGEQKRFSSLAREHAARFSWPSVALRYRDALAALPLHGAS